MSCSRLKPHLPPLPIRYTSTRLGTLPICPPTLTASISIILLFPFFNSVSLWCPEERCCLKDTQAVWGFTCSTSTHISFFLVCGLKSSCDVSGLESINLSFSNSRQIQEGGKYEQSNLKSANCVSDYSGHKKTTNLRTKFLHPTGRVACCSALFTQPLTF